MQPLIESPARPALDSFANFTPRSPERDGFSLTTLIGALRRRKRLILATVLLTVTAVFCLVEVLPARYTATAELEIKPADTREIVSKPVAKGLPDWMPGDNAEMVTQVGILRAPALAGRTVKTLRLADDPEFQSSLVRIVRTVSALVPRWLPASWQTIIIPWPSDTDSVAQRDEVAVQRLQRALSVKQEEGAHIVRVAVTVNDPAKAARIANTLVKQYLDDQIAAKYRTTNRAYQWATEQVGTQRQQLAAAEHSVVEYMASHGLTASNGLPQPNEAPPGRATFGGLTGQQLVSLQDQLTEARAQLAAKQARAAELDSMQARNVGFASLPEVISSPVIAQLEQADVTVRSQEARIAGTYGTSTATLQVISSIRSSITKHIAAEIAGIAQNIRDAAVTAHDRVARLEAMLNRGLQEYFASERASVDLRELTRDVAVRRALYDKLLLQVNEISQQMALIQPDAAVISAAVPPTAPSFPNKLVFGGIGVLGSLLLGFMLAALAEHNDRTLRTGPEVEKALGVPNFGLVPLLKPHRRGDPLHALIFQQPQSVYSEAIRAILIQLLRPGAQVVLVTSALPKEGKTTTALSLAAAAARSGRRTVLVDLDLRQPSVAKEARLTVHAGLAEFMAGEATFDEIVHTGEVDKRLHMVPLRAAMPEVSTLLSSSNIRSLVDTLRKNYDCILFDLAPSLAVSDIQPFVTFADATLFVVRWGSTSCTAAVSGMTLLTRIGLPISGVALTHVDLKRHALYGYEQFGEYHMRYLEYFHQTGPTP